mgnify:CR=1 FL=1
MRASKAVDGLAWIADRDEPPLRHLPKHRVIERGQVLCLQEDREPLLQTFGQLQEIRTYYDFIAVDDDRSLRSTKGLTW